MMGQRDDQQLAGLRSIDHVEWKPAQRKATGFCYPDTPQLRLPGQQCKHSFKFGKQGGTQLPVGLSGVEDCRRLQLFGCGGVQDDIHLIAARACARAVCKATVPLAPLSISAKRLATSAAQAASFSAS